MFFDERRWTRCSRVSVCVRAQIRSCIILPTFVRWTFWEHLITVDSVYSSYSLSLFTFFFFHSLESPCESFGLMSLPGFRNFRWRSFGQREPVFSQSNHHVTTLHVSPRVQSHVHTLVDRALADKRTHVYNISFGSVPFHSSTDQCIFLWEAYFVCILLHIFTEGCIENDVRDIRSNEEFDSS